MAIDGMWSHTLLHHKQDNYDALDFDRVKVFYTD
jgi:hypothetical protein